MVSEKTRNEGHMSKGDEIASFKEFVPHILFTDLFECKPGWRVKGRSHPDNHELLCILKGRGRVVIGDRSFEAEKGDVFLIKPGEVHAAEADPEDPYIYFTLFYNFSLRKEMELKLRDIRFSEQEMGLSYFFANEYEVTSRVKVEEEELRRIADRIVFEKSYQEIGYQEAVRACLLELLVMIARASRSVKGRWHTTTLENRDHLIVKGIKEYLEDNYSRHLMLEEITRSCPLSPHYCCSIFKEVTGYTIFQYLSKIRVEKAKSLLRYSHQNITEVSAKVGFQDIFYFSRVFKKVTGVSPSQFMRLIHR